MKKTLWIWIDLNRILTTEEILNVLLQIERMSCVYLLIHSLFLSYIHSSSVNRFNKATMTLTSKSWDVLRSHLWIHHKLLPSLYSFPIELTSGLNILPPKMASLFLLLFSIIITNAEFNLGPFPPNHDQ